ncbi:hypothetical protein [Castellaniella sp.]|uniref:hypothetical protein n=1 Tax=Castellaniella sp. TaxID=1955812 RepID=UPI002AFFD241|nr:hypothetical protein [Castellaniella sp.]
MQIRVVWADQALKKWSDQITRLNREFPTIVPRIVNQVGRRARTQVINNLTKQTGLKRSVIVRAVKESVSSSGNLKYSLTTRGGYIRLKYLNPKETPAGVVAKPFGQSRLYAGSFFKGGKFPRRKVVKQFDGHVYRRLNPSGSKITQVRSEVRIPEEMLEGATYNAFESTAAPLLQQRIEAVLRKKGFS